MTVVHSRDDKGVGSAYNKITPPKNQLQISQMMMMALHG